MVSDIRKYLFDKLFFPKVAVINRPGIIINQASSFYGLKKSQKRILYLFEDCLANLQKETIDKIGPENSSLLYYKIGKDLAMRHLYTSNPKRPPGFMLPSLIREIFNSFVSAGMTLADNVSFDEKNCRLILTGSENMICRKTEDASLFAGVASAVMCFLTGKNVEAKADCTNCPNGCRIVADKTFEEVYIPNISDLMPIENFDEMNFHIPELRTGEDNRASIESLMKFRKISYRNGKHYFRDEVIIPLEISIPSIYVLNYKRINQVELLKKSLTKNGEKRAGILLRDLDVNEKIKSLKQILTAFGGGSIVLDNEGAKIRARVIRAPVTKYGPVFHASILNGYLNNIFNRSYKTEQIIIKKSNPPEIQVMYNAS